MNSKEVLLPLKGYKVKAKTKRGLLCMGLLATGHKLNPEKCTSKYLAFEHSQDGFYFVGKSAALRKGKTASSSISLENTRHYRAFLTIGDRIEDISNEDSAHNTLESFTTEYRN